MLWLKKTEIGLSIDTKKVILERLTVLGQPQRLKYIETVFPPKNGASGDRIISISRTRFLWRFRIRHPLETICYKKNKDGEWEEIGSGIP